MGSQFNVLQEPNRKLTNKIAVIMSIIFLLNKDYPQYSETDSIQTIGIKSFNLQI